MLDVLMWANVRCFVIIFAAWGLLFFLLAQRLLYELVFTLCALCAFLFSLPYLSLLFEVHSSQLIHLRRVGF